ncbi:transposase from transposon Tn916 [Lachnospiraceae bacterium]|nr:transposase from transposon Tn916 [Lachnospiraceae bacterium]
MKCWAVKLFTAKTVVNVVAHYGDLVLASPFFNHKPLIFYRPVEISVKNRQPDIAYSIFADRNSQFRMLSAFSCHDIHLPYTKRTMAQTIALEGIISCSVFHFHEVTLIFRFHELRHTYCSNMAKSGMNPKTLQYLMGHSDIGVTLNTYTHLGLEDATDELRRMEDLENARKELEKNKEEKPISQKMFRAI